MTMPFAGTAVLRAGEESTLARPRGILGALVAGYVALLPYQFEAGSHLNLAPADAFLLLIGLFALTRLKYCQPAWAVWHFALAVTFALGSLVAALRFGTLDRYELLNKDIGLLLPFFSYAVFTSYVRRWEDLRRVLRIFVLGVVVENTVAVTGFLAAYFFHVRDPFTRYGGLRLSGTMLDPNAYGGLLVAALVISEGASWGRAPLFQGWMLRFTRLVLSLGVLFTFSRSAWVALCLGLVLLSLTRVKIAVRYLIALLIAAPGLLLAMGPRFVPIFERLASRPKQVQGRFDLIEAALAAFARHPVLGGGIGSFRLAQGEIAHNSAMWFLADFGAVGLLVFLGFVAWFFVKGWMAYRFAPEKEQPLVLGLLAGHAAMFGLAMGIEAFYQRHWWLVFALIASSYTLARRRMSRLPSGLGVWR